MRALIATVSLACALPVMAANMDLTTEENKLSYTLGADMGQSLKRQGIKINPDAVASGLKDALTGDTLQMTEAQMKETIQAFQKALIEKRMAEFKKSAEENAKASQAFLSNNKSVDGVVELPSGLQYKVMDKGTGDKPSDDDTVMVEYEGRLPNGNVFDKSEEPVSFGLSRVISGWTEALKLMPVGSQWEVYIPSKLAYGERGYGQKIGPNQALVFKIKLLSIKKASAENAG